MQFYYLATTCSTCGREQPLDGVVANFFRGNGIGPQETRENYDAKFRVLRELLNRDDPGVYGAIKARIVPVETVTGNA